MTGITYREYYECLCQYALLMKEDVKTIAPMMWNRGIDKNDAVMIINKSVSNQEDDSYDEDIWLWMAEIFKEIRNRK